MRFNKETEHSNWSCVKCNLLYILRFWNDEDVWVQMAGVQGHHVGCPICRWLNILFHMHIISQDMTMWTQTSLLCILKMDGIWVQGCWCNLLEMVGRRQGTNSTTTCRVFSARMTMGKLISCTYSRCNILEHHVPKLVYPLALPYILFMLANKVKSDPIAGDHGTPNAHNHWFYSILSWLGTRTIRHSIEGPVTYDFTTHLRVRDHTTWFWFWRCVGTAFGHFLLGSQNFMVMALGLCVCVWSGP